MDIRLLLMPQCSGKPTIRTGSGARRLDGVDHGRAELAFGVAGKRAARRLDG
jgi:hypothetical protein